MRLVSLSELHLAPDNPRTIDPHRLELLKRSLESDREMLEVRPLIALLDGTVICGNQRLRAAQSLGWETIPVVLVDLDERRAKEWMLRDNNAFGEWVPDDLAALLEELRVEGADLDLLGFDDQELEQLLDRLTKDAGLSDPDDAPPLPDEPVSRRGDRWLLGDHQVACGDATDPQDLSTMMGGKLAACLWTDPPYGVSYEGGTSDHLTIQNDGAAGLPELLQKAFQCADAVMRAGAVYYITHPDVFTYEFAGAIRSVGWVQARPAVILWIKDRFVLGRGDYHSRSEPILYGWKPGAPHRRVSDRTQDNVWEFPRPSKSEAHPTMKPVNLIARALRNSTRRDDIVLDPFLGSGSTLIAAHQLGRRCRGVEIDPRYVDVAVRRWQSYTGKAATLAGHDRTFAEIAEARHGR